MSIFCLLLGMFTGGLILTGWWGKRFIKKYAELNNNTYKFQLYLSVACKWIRINQQKGSIEHWFYKNHYKDVIIYGMGELGGMLIHELEKTDINIICGIDKSSLEMPMVKTIRPNDVIPSADVIIVTPIAYYEEIKKLLQNKTDCRIISIEQIFAETLLMCRGE